MDTSYDWRRHTRLVSRTILLIAIILAVVITGCDGSGLYQLTILSTPGGSVTSPGEGVFAYRAGTVIELIATPDGGYEFQVWVGDTEHVADPNSASTTVAVNGNYSITASFQEKDGAGPSPVQPH